MNFYEIAVLQRLVLTPLHAGLDGRAFPPDETRLSSCLAIGSSPAFLTFVCGFHRF